MDMDKLNNARRDMRNATERMGELAAEAWIARSSEKFPDAKPLYAATRGGQGGQFDRIYQTSDGRIILIEAKGGASPLGSRMVGGRYFQQGHPEYLKDVIDNYSRQFRFARKDSGVSSEELAEMKKTNDALQRDKEGNPPNIEYYVVRQTIDKDGNPGRIMVHIFR